VAHDCSSDVLLHTCENWAESLLFHSKKNFLGAGGVASEKPEKTRIADEAKMAPSGPKGPLCCGVLCTG
jgi:hypothetical protein